jgi:hypothetical protein
MHGTVHVTTSLDAYIDGQAEIPTTIPSRFERGSRESATISSVLFSGSQMEQVDVEARQTNISRQTP